MRLRGVLVTATLLIALVGGLFAALSLGEVVVAPGDVVAAIAGTGGGDAYIVSEFRLPRAIGAILVGAGLGMSGAVTQSLLRNPLASPDIVGVTTGAGAAAVAVLVAGGASAVPATLSGVPLPAAALTGGVVAGSAVVLLAWRRGLAPHRVVLVGLGINACCAALTSWLLLQADSSGLGASLIWLTGSLNAVRPDVLLPVAIVVAIGACVLAAGSRTLATLSFDLRVAAALGVRVAAAQLLMLGCAVALAATVTVVGGPVPFVAFIAPQIAAVLLRSGGHSPLLAGLVGAVAVLAADFAAARVAPVPLPVGVVTSFVGVPFLIWLLLRGRKTRCYRRGQ